MHRTGERLEALRKSCAGELTAEQFLNANPERFARQLANGCFFWLDFAEAYAQAVRQEAQHYLENWKAQAKADQSVIAEIGAERDALSKENERLILQYTVAHSYWFDGDAHFDSPEQYADEQNLKIGEEFELDAATYWEEKFRVTKVPDDKNDDYECETISKKREEFEEYGAIKARAERAEGALREATQDRCGNCDHHTELHNIHGCIVRIQLEDGKTMVDCPCGWDNLQASSAKGEQK